jgi:hypothetical protein
MKRNTSLIVLFLIMGVSSLFSAVVNDYAITTGTKAAVYDTGDTSLPWHVSSSDLINGVTATLVGGDFHSATVPADQTGRLNVLTNGTWDTNGYSVICSDRDIVGGPALIVEYSFTSAKNIAEIRVFAGHDGDGSRGFINCDVAIDHGSGYIDLYKEFKTGPYGASSHNNSMVSAARLYQNAGNNIAVTVQKIKFTFYDVTHNDNPKYIFKKYDDAIGYGGTNIPNQGTILKEIDVLEGPSSEENWYIY